MPDSDGAFEIFEQVRTARPGCPIVGACKSQDIYQLPRFITGGMRSYVPRDLGGDFVFLLQTTLESTVQAVRAEREQIVAQQMRHEIESVRRFQDSVIPKQLAAPSGYRLAGRYEPAQIRVVGGTPVNLAGGDYYEVFQLDKRNVVLLVGDAAGHGMRACMSIMTLHTLVKMIATRKFRRTEVFVSEINRHFCRQSVNQNDGSLITLLYGILRVDRGEFRWTSAGHPLPLLHDRARDSIGSVADTDMAGPPLGVDDTFRYRSHLVKLPPRSRLLLYTDGLVEAYPEAHEKLQFGIPGVAVTLRRTANESVDMALEALLEDSHAFTQGAGRHDDTSALLLERG
jgi:serine phosphatase RsbU (regulator of sigma subunit)